MNAIKQIPYNQDELKLAEAIYVSLISHAVTHPNPVGFSAKASARLALDAARAFYETLLEA